jgi:hypothetical protein
MWFYYKSAEEIRERLLKEGVFAKLLEDAELEANHVEEAQKTLNTDEVIDLLESVADEILLPHLRSIYPPNGLEVKQYKYKRTEAVGGSLLDLLTQAKQSIYVTHFAVEEYSELYIELQIEKVYQGLVFERIVYFNNEYSEKYAWLDRFFDKNGEPINRYRQYELRSNRPPLPYDLMIIDEKCAALVHRGPIIETDHMSDAIGFFENDLVVTYFLDVWKYLKPQENRRKGRKVWANMVIPFDRK